MASGHPCASKIKPEVGSFRHPGLPLPLSARSTMIDKRSILVPLSNEVAELFTYLLPNI